MLNSEKRYYSQSDFWNRDFHSIPAQREKIVKTIERIPSDVRSILDVGCGNGALLNPLFNKYDTVGLDFSEEALRHVRTLKVHGDAAALPFRSQSFDLVTCLEVLEHLPHEAFQRTLFGIERVSRKYIMISVPNAQDLNYDLVICPECRCWYHPSRHVRSFNPEKLKSLFERFELLELGKMGPLAFRPRYSQPSYAAYRLLKNASPPRKAVCPQCGYQADKSEASKTSKEKQKHNLLYYALTLMKMPIQGIWFPRWIQKWLFALYVRSNRME